MTQQKYFLKKKFFSYKRETLISCPEKMVERDPVESLIEASFNIDLYTEKDRIKSEINCVLEPVKQLKKQVRKVRQEISPTIRSLKQKKREICDNDYEINCDNDYVSYDGDQDGVYAYVTNRFILNLYQFHK